MNPKEFVTQANTVHVLAVCFALGVVVHVLDSLFLSTALALGLVLLTWFSYKWGMRSLCILAVLAATAGFLRSEIDHKQHIHNNLDSYIGDEVTLELLVSEESDVRDNGVNITAYSHEYDVKILLRTVFYPEYQYGDVLTVSGRLELPESFVGDTGREFDYPGYLRKDNIRYIMWYPNIELVATNQGHVIKSHLLKLKQALIAQIEVILPEPHSSLLGGLLLGAKSSMGQSLLDDFRDTGVIHIVVLSGFNITIVAWFFVTMFAFLGQRAITYMASIAIFCFAIMTGAGATVVRASLMAILVIIAKATGNYSQVMRMLSITGCLMIAWNPMILVYDPGFQLSFIAAFGLISLSPVIEKYLYWVYEGKLIQLRSLLAGTISTQIMVTPALLYMMGTFPTYSLITNFLILSAVPLTMGLGFVATVVSFFSETLAFVLSVLTYGLLHYDLVVVNIFANMPYAAFDIPPFGFIWVVVMYGVYAMIWLYWRHNKKHL